MSPNILPWITDQELRVLVLISNHLAWEMKTMLKTSPWLKVKLWVGWSICVDWIAKGTELLVSVMSNVLLYCPYLFN